MSLLHADLLLARRLEGVEAETNRRAVAAAPVSAESIDRVVMPSGVTMVIAEQHTTQAVEASMLKRIVQNQQPTARFDCLSS